MRRLLTSALLACTTAACTSGDVVCLAVAYPSLLITVRDATTGATITAGSTIIVTARDGSAADTVAVPDIAAANGMPASVELGAGTFDVVVRRPGYREAVRQAVNVPIGGNRRCRDPVTQSLDVVLTKA